MIYLKLNNTKKSGSPNSLRRYDNHNIRPLPQYGAILTLITSNSPIFIDVFSADCALLDLSCNYFGKSIVF